MSEKKPTKTKPTKGIIIKVDEHIYRFKAGDQAAYGKIPWQQRKQLIQLLEDIKQAEFVKQPGPKDAAQAAQPTVQQKASTVPSATPAKARAEESGAALQATTQTPTPKAQASPNSSSQSSEGDIDDLMTRLLVEQNQHGRGHGHGVPDKTAVYKWFLIIFVVILVLALIF